jgi:hypothetical protein
MAKIALTCVNWACIYTPPAASVSVPHRGPIVQACADKGRMKSKNHCIESWFNMPLVGTVAEAAGGGGGG